MTHDPQAGKKFRDAISRFLPQKSGTVSLYESKVDTLLDCFAPDAESCFQIQSLVEDMLFRYLLASAKMIKANSTEQSFDAELDRFIKRKTQLAGDRVLEFRRLLKNAVLTTTQDRPKSSTKTRILKKQRNNLCYLCGEPIEESEEKLDHQWPLSAGGGNGSNLQRAHRRCEEAKSDLAVSGDAAVGRFAFSNNLPDRLKFAGGDWWPYEIESDEQFLSFADDIRATQLRFAVLRRQDFTCHQCKGLISKVGGGSLVRRETDEPWWYPNTIFVCSFCHPRSQQDA